MERTELPIAVFDSGLGGISVLRALVQRLPGEDFLYFGDSANAPYGVRPVAEVRRLTQEVIGRLYDRGIKAAVIASPNGMYPPRMVPCASTAHSTNRCAPVMSVRRCSCFHNPAAHAAACPIRTGIDADRLALCLSISLRLPCCFPSISQRRRAAWREITAGIAF